MPITDYTKKSERLIFKAGWNECIKYLLKDIKTQGFCSQIDCTETHQKHKITDKDKVARLQCR